MNKKMVFSKKTYVAGGILVAVVVVWFVVSIVLGAMNPYISYDYGYGGGIAGQICFYHYEKVGRDYYYTYQTSFNGSDNQQKKISALQFHLKGVLLRSMNLEAHNGFSSREDGCDGYSYGLRLISQSGETTELEGYGLSKWPFEDVCSKFWIELIF